ncbi:MAG: radical SAM protein [Butyrivibrio sp.]|nr:radical SAM protein [Butyrivibrio sp.]
MQIDNDSYINEYRNCTLCPRTCGVDRTKKRGYCRELSELHVARASLHMWEEPCISGKRGSGTVFFSGCNMGCVFCQNKTISRGKTGKIISIDRLVDIFFELEDMGANNINLVTGDMFIPTIRKAIDIAKSRGIGIPFLMNTSSYISVETLKSLEGLIDIYLPDFKYIRNQDAIRYSNSPGYVEAAKAAISEMVRQQPECVFGNDERLMEQTGKDNVVEEKTPDEAGMNSASKCTPEQGMLQKGVVVRHLLMPGMIIQAKLIVKYLYEHYGNSIYISLMNQYTPNGNLSEFPEIDRKVTSSEYDSLIDYAAQIGVINGFMQIGETATESFIPEFDCRGV